MSVYMYLKINALGDYKKKYDPFARLLALKRGVGVCSVVGVVSGFYGTVPRLKEQQHTLTVQEENNCTTQNTISPASAFRCNNFNLADTKTCSSLRSLRSTTCTG